MTFTKTLIRWYEECQRALPWRGERDPYKIWISEIILQQTRVVQGWNYYHRFMMRFPTINDLANAHEYQVLKIWQGLGYYSRARNLHSAAKTIMQQYQGVFPNRYEDIKKLKGIGNYTAAAIASIAFNLPYPAVDGNVLRVISRFAGITEDISMPSTVKKITQICNQWIDSTQPGIFNQALMDFGALVCIPKNPSCETCPLQKHCYAYIQGLTKQIPVKSNRVKVKERFFLYLVLAKADKILVQQRIRKDIWRHLYELPLIETQEPISAKQVEKYVQDKYPTIDYVSCQKLWHTTTKLTHQIIHAEFYGISATSLPIPESHQKIIDKTQLPQLPVARILQDFFAKFQ